MCEADDDSYLLVTSVKLFHTVLAEGKVSCGCELIRTFKNTLLTDILVALPTWGFAGVSGCQGDSLMRHPNYALPPSSAGRASHGKVR